MIEMVMVPVLLFAVVSVGSLLGDSAEDIHNNKSREATRNAKN